MDYSFLRLSAEWVEAFRDIRLEALRLHPRNYSHTFDQERAWPRERFARYLEQAYVFGVVYGEAQLVGIAALIPYESPILEHKARIGNVYLKKEYRGQGIGRRLIEHLIASAHAYVEQIYIEVAADNHVAHQLYSSLGFEQYGYEKNAAKLDGEYIDDILMVRFVN